MRDKFFWVLDEGKFLTGSEVKRLRAFLVKRKDDALKSFKKVPVRDWFVVNLALFAGLRVMEISGLKHGDLVILNGNSSLFVRKGKCGKSRPVKFGRELKKIMLEYVGWKRSVGDPCGPNDPLVVSSNTKRHMTTRGLQKVFERNAKRAGVVGHSIHHLRHTYGSHLYKSSGYNLRLVQKQLGHSRIEVTEVYAHVFRPDLERAVSSLYG